MYGRPFGKSLSHAWGASPICLLGKYYLGVKPTYPGYQTYNVGPCLGDLQWMEEDVPTPTPESKIHLYCSPKEMKVKAGQGTGTLRFGSLTKIVCMAGSKLKNGESRNFQQFFDSPISWRNSYFTIRNYCSTSSTWK
jgi:hypothetical protein